MIPPSSTVFQKFQSNKLALSVLAVASLVAELAPAQSVTPHRASDIINRPITLLRPQAAVNTTWTGGVGNYSNAAMWTNGVPNGNFNAFIDGGNPVASAVSLDISASLNNLAISAGDSLGINNNQVLTVNGTSITNAGQLTLNSAGNLTQLIIGGANVTLSGAGTLTMSNSSANYIYGTVGTNVFTNQQTIQGAGVIGNGQLTLVNSGIINANVSNQLVINPSGGTTNTGTLEASAGGTLNLQGGVTNTGGTILATGAGSIVSLNGATVTGGTLNAAAGGLIQSSGTLGALTNAGTLQVVNNTSTTLNGNITNTGSIQLNSAGNLTQLLIGAPTVTLSGSGSVTLSNNPANYIYGAVNGNTLINQQTIQGAGVIGNGQLTLVNAGTIDANVSTQLLINPNGGTTNTGTLEATAGGTLALQDGITNTGASIQAGAGSTVLVNGATITGGTLGTGAGGTIQSFGGTFSSLTNSGVLQVPNNNSATFVGAIKNTGTVQLNSGGNNTFLVASGPVTLTGGGAVTLSNTSTNYITGTAADSFTNQDNTLSGSGNIGNNALAFTNHGVVDATSASGNHLTIQPGAAGATNTATFEASSGGTLELQNSVTNTGGTIQALAGTGTAAGGTVLLNGSTITGGLVQSLGSGVNAGTVLAPNASLTNLTTAGTIQIPNNTTLTLVGTINNTGVLQSNSVGNNTELLASGAVTLKGGGSVLLSDFSTNYIFGAAGSTLLNVDNTISGAGNIGNGVTGFTNDATVDATSAHGNHLVLNSGTAGVTNLGLMEASSGGNLDIETVVTNFNGTTNGTIEALAGGVVELKSATIKGGILSTTGSGVISSAGSLLDALTLSGKLQVPNNQTTTLEGTIVDNGSISLLSAGNNTKLKIAGSSVTLQGTGSVVLSDFGTNFILGASTGKENLINDLTISGAGNIGDNFLTLTNQGKIFATSTKGNHLIIQPGTGGATNTGTMAATGTATLELANTFTNTGGIISASAVSSTVQLDNSALITGGTLTGPGTFVAFGATLSGLTNAGVVQVPNNNLLNLLGTINNTGTIQVNSGGNFTELSTSGTVTLTGSGNVTLSPNTNNFLSGAGGSTLVNQNNTISGSGNIGGNTIAFTNQGIVNATTNANLTIQAAGAGATNTATMEASSGGTLDLENTITNTGGKIIALAGTGTSAGGTVLINGAVVTGGTLSSLGTGVNAGAFFSTGGTLNNLTNASTLQIANNNNSYLQGNIVNTGNIQVNSGGNATFLYIKGNVTISGAGSITLSNNSNNYIEGASTGSEVLTNASTIQGSGNLGNGFMGLVNQGLILANQSTPLIINASAGFNNAGTLESAAGSLLQITGPFSNFSGTTLTGGKYVVDGTLQFTGANIVTNAASITLAGPSAQIVNEGNVNALTNFTTNTASGKFTLSGGQALTTSAGTFTNAGTLTIGSGSSFIVGNGGNTNLATNYTQTGGATIVDGTLTSSPSAAGTPTLNLQSGSLFGQGTVIDAVKSSGIITPGDSSLITGKLGVTGAYTQNSTGALDISIGGVAVGTKYDQLNVSGSAALSGSLNLKTVNGFIPTVGATFDILNATNLLGTFTTVTGTAINGSEHYAVTYNGTEVIVTVVSGAAVNKSGLGLLLTSAHGHNNSFLESVANGSRSIQSPRNSQGRDISVSRSAISIRLDSIHSAISSAPAPSLRSGNTSFQNVSANNFGAAPFGTTGYRKVLDYHLELGSVIKAIHGHSLMGTLHDLGSQYNNLGYITYR